MIFDAHGAYSLEALQHCFDTLNEEVKELRTSFHMRRVLDVLYAEERRTRSVEHGGAGWFNQTPITYWDNMEPGTITAITTSNRSVTFRFPKPIVERNW